ncbi:ABC transporter ATP-binding protein [Desulfobulbus sp.]|uniref:ABC transporter ATP-binding protein n=1 Tax=Desulfobulbus sp. TaxID=895 RepID=UPI00286FA49F|nr:ABC transporter ATP-binding protein [Desulfobulbus sp.]
MFKKESFALQDVSFALPECETLGLIGANGAGKSTTIRLLMDFIRPDTGTITLFGQPVTDLGLRNRIGYLPETASFPANLTILDLIRFTAATCDMTAEVWKERSASLLNTLGLWEARHKRLCTYSKGMQQRANFVLALLNDPQLLILDEPMSGLDPIGRGQIIDLIQRLKNEGKTILFCSHILGDVDRLVDKLLVLHKGKTLFAGPPHELLIQQQADTIEAAFLYLINSMKDGQHDA